MEFNNKSLQEFFERGYRIITGIATEEESAKTIHHVCSAHMMKLIKGHAKKCCEISLPANSQIHFAMNSFFQTSYMLVYFERNEEYSLLRPIHIQK